MAIGTSGPTTVVAFRDQECSQDATAGPLQGALHCECNMWLKYVLFSCFQIKAKSPRCGKSPVRGLGHAPGLCFYDCKLTVTLGLGVPPEQLSTLAARSAPEAGSAGTLTADLWGKVAHSYHLKC